MFALVFSKAYMLRLKKKLEHSDKRKQVEFKSINTDRYRIINENTFQF